MKTINLQKELKFIYSKKIKISDKESLLFQLLNIAQILLSNYATAETKELRYFYKIIYLQTSDFYLENLKVN